jgi:hypothetical protein
MDWGEFTAHPTEPNPEQKGNVEYHYR